MPIKYKEGVDRRQVFITSFEELVAEDSFTKESSVVGKEGIVTPKKDPTIQPRGNHIARISC